MESIYLEQIKCGEEIQRIVRNYQKDSAVRKNVAYFTKRLEQLEVAWTAFEEKDNIIRDQFSEQLSHPYFTTDYYNQIKVIWEKIQDECRRNILASSVPEDNQPIRELKTAVLEKWPEEDRTYPVGDTVSEEINKLIKVKRRQMYKLEKDMDEIDNYEGVKSKEYLEVMLETLEKLWDRIEQSDEQITPRHTTDTPRYEQLQMRYRITRVNMKTELSKLSNSTNPSNANGNDQAAYSFKLPTIEIPKFDGNYLKWRQFHDLFVQMVHSRNIGNCQKLWYLKTNVVGEAERLIRHINVTDNNYEAAWDTLVQRYENKRLIVTTILNELMSQPALSAENPTAIKRLHDTSKECVMALENLQISTSSWDPILVHIIIRKLDKTTHSQYETSLTAPKELQSFRELLRFLEVRFQSLEAVGSKGKWESPAVRVLTAVAEQKSCAECKGNHPLFACQKFLHQDSQQRFTTVKRLGICYNCLKAGHTSNTCQSRGCTICGRKHNTLIHFPTRDQAQERVVQSAEQVKSTESRVSSSKAVSGCVNGRDSYVMLGTVVVNLVNSDGIFIPARAILDSGSQVNLISSRLAKLLGLEGKREVMQIEGIGARIQKSEKRINIEIHSRVGNFVTRIETFVLPSITGPQPAQHIDVSSWNLPTTLELADPNFNRRSCIDLLIGAELYHEILVEGQLQVGRNLPMIKNTVFGWMVIGKLETQPSLNQLSCGLTTETEISKQLERFWELEELEELNTTMCEADVKCEAEFEKGVKRDATGRFTVGLPFADGPDKLGESHNAALRRFFAMERKLERNRNLKDQYVSFMREYESLGHMTEIKHRDIGLPNYYLPHHFVLKPDSTTTKLRVVFDASAKTATNLSLNNILFNGPILQAELFTQLLKFRLPRYAFTADIEKMYRQINIHEHHRRFQLIWWRECPNQPMKVYKLNTVTYGTAAAPYLATKCLQRLAQDGRDNYPLGSRVLEHDFYMDDVMAGANSMSMVASIQSQLTELLQSAGFHLRKWSANHETLLQQLPPEDVEVNLNKPEQLEDKVKTLGLVWKPKSDTLEIKSCPKEIDILTKRVAYSHIAQLFDPLGLMGPVVVTAKIFLQQLWLRKLGWDDRLDNELTKSWANFINGLNRMQDIRFPRHIFGHSLVTESQLHIFVDASEKAFGAAAYIRTETKDTRIRVRLLCAKSRVAPIKAQTLPRLELCAAKLGTDLAIRIKKDLKYEGKLNIWSDSEIVLAWIQSSSRSFQTFVANRIASIQSSTTPEQWRYVPSKDNPADLLSRGIAPEKFKDAEIWFDGPLFLHGDETMWPPLFTPKTEVGLERKKNPAISLPVVSNNPSNMLTEINHRNSYQFLRRVMAYVVKFTSRLKNKNKAGCQWVTTEELSRAEQVIMSVVQEEQFKDELLQIKKNKEVNNQSSLVGLDPFIDNQGLLRVGGRLCHAAITYETKHPILLPYNNEVTRLVMQDIHQRYLHVGPQGLIAITRQRYWIIKGKSMARTIVHKCVKCSRANPQLLQQMMGNLPKHRIEPARPFINTGVDFCGPLNTHYKLRGKRPQKSYVAIFCCFATKAVHMELVTDLSTDGFIGALKRFVGRRGYCKNIYSDNATNFVGARNKLRELTELKEMFQSKRAREQIAKTCSEKTIEFHFIPPRAPHFGGLWEAAVKSAKYLLQRVVHSAALTYEELETVVVEAEAILNSRPLTPMSNDPRDLAALTPGHFLIGEPLTQPVDSTATPIRVGILARWKLVKLIQNKFWERWSREYLSELQERHKWRSRKEGISPGKLVIIKEDGLPPLKWKLGRVTKTIESKSDGLIRVAEVQTANGVLTRAIHRLAPLPVD